MHVSGNELSFQQEHLQKSAPGLCTLIYRVKSTEYYNHCSSLFTLEQLPTRADHESYSILTEGKYSKISACERHVCDNRIPCVSWLVKQSFVTVVYLPRLRGVILRMRLSFTAHKRIVLIAYASILAVFIAKRQSHSSFMGMLCVVGVPTVFPENSGIY